MTEENCGPPNNEEQNEEEESIQYEDPNVFSLSDDGICDGSFAKYFCFFAWASRIISSLLLLANDQADRAAALRRPNSGNRTD
jgi:hypothetical protein